MEQQLKAVIGTRVQIKSGAGKKGQIVMHFADAAEFERLRGMLMAM